MERQRLRPPVRRVAAFVVALGGASCAAVVGLDDYSIVANETDASADGGPAHEASAADSASAADASCTATLRGKVLDPRGVNGVPGAIVYLPATTPAPFPAGHACDSCASLMTGSPLSTAVTDGDGAFVLSNVPVGRPFPVVLLSGRWRRQVDVDAIASCSATASLPPPQSTLPKNHLEGDIPRIAITLGLGDHPECLLRKIGIDDDEMTSAGGEGRVHLYLLNAETIDGGTPGPTALWGDPAALAKYDLVMTPCDSTHANAAGTGPTTTPPTATATPAQQANMKAYLEAGGRLVGTHWLAHDFVYGNWPPPAGPITEEFGQNVDADRGPPAFAYTIDPGSTLGGQLAAAAGGPTLTLENWRHTVVTVNTDAGATRLLYGDSTAPPLSRPQTPALYGGPHIGAYTFDTPWPSGGCGRVAALTGHATLVDAGAPMTFPDICGAAAAPLTMDERAAEVLVFHAGACFGAPLD